MANAGRHLGAVALNAKATAPRCDRATAPHRARVDIGQASRQRRERMPQYGPRRRAPTCI
ncbi:hypothetical protein WJ17_19475 [Burkholderia vietnamiensis]|nr:hypothetical protein WJ17_19475 [Burkholderia vietnamiensis]